MKTGDFYRIGAARFGRGFTKRLPSIAILLVAGAITARAQTNAPASFHSLFSCPVPQIEPEAKPAPKPTAPNPTSLVPAPLSLETDSVQETNPLSEYMRWNGHEVLIVPPPLPVGGVLGWFDQEILNPAVIRYHRTQLTGSIISAITRRNPLCLLHPLIFSVDW